MATWAIAYDLDVKGMKLAGYTKSQVTQFYNSVRTCLAEHKFESLKQFSIYTSKNDNSIADAFQVCISLKTIPDTDKFVKRLHLFRIEDFNDLLPLLVLDKVSSQEDVIEEEINMVFPEPELVAA
jgi:virulence-associated protein VapD